MIAYIFTPFRSVFSRCTFGCNHSTESVWICLNEAGTSGHCNFSPFFLAKQLNLCQVAWGSGVNSSFQVQSQILDWIVQFHGKDKLQWYSPTEGWRAAEAHWATAPEASFHNYFWSCSKLITEAVSLMGPLLLSWHHIMASSEVAPKQPLVFLIVQINYKLLGCTACKLLG